MIDATTALTSAFEGSAKGDLSGFARDYVHLGYDIDGAPRIFDRETFWATMARMQADFDVFESEVVPVGDELIFVSVNVHRRTRDGREYRGKMGSMFRVEGGLVTHGSDLGEAGLQRYWASLGLEPC